MTWFQPIISEGSHGAQGVNVVMYIWQSDIWQWQVTHLKSSDADDP